MPKGGKSKWDDRNYVTAYRLARAGASDPQIGHALGVSHEGMRLWVRDRPALAEALRTAREPDPDCDGGTFRDYVYARLPDRLQQLWDRLDLCDELDNGTSRAEAMLRGEGDDARQHLFLYALIHCNFNASEACRKVCVTKRQLDNWVKRSPDFAELVDEIQWHKGNFFEGALCQLVAKGELAAIIHANKTYNRGRGYGETLKVDVKAGGRVEHEHTHQHLHAMVRLSDLELPVEVMEQVLLAMRARDATAALPAGSGLGQMRSGQASYEVPGQPGGDDGTSLVPVPDPRDGVGLG